MAETTPEQNLFKLSLNPIQNYFSIDIGNELEVERFYEKNGILDHMDATHKIDILEQFIQCLLQLYQQSITCPQLSSSQRTHLKNQLFVPDKSERTNDIHSLANIYCSVLTNEKWQNYSEELPLKDIQCSDPDIALDILKVMTKDNTTDTKEVFLHPFYWIDVKKVDFLCSAFHYINSEILKSDWTPIIVQQNKFNMYIVHGVIPECGWIKCMIIEKQISKDNWIKDDVIFNLARKSHVKNNTIFELIRFFKKQYECRHENSDDIKIAFGGYPAGYLRFFTSRFPNLFMHVYRNMNIHLRGDTELERDLDDLTIHDKSFHSSEAEGGPVKEASPEVLPSNEATADLNECIQSKLNRKVYDFLQELRTNRAFLDNPVEEKKISSILRDINSVTKPLNPPQDQLPTMEQLFRDAGKSDEYTTELGVKRSRREVSNLTTLDKSCHSSETEGEPVEKALRDVLPSKKTYIGESSGKTSHKEIRTRFFDVAKPPEDTEQDQLPANEQLFRDAGKSDEYTTELGVKESRREVGILSTLDKSLHSSETEGEPVRKSSSDVLPSNETPTCQSKSVIIRYEKHDSTRDVEINEIVNIIKSNSEVDMIEFCDYKIGNDYCAPEENQKNTAKCKISKLIISYTDHFKEFSPFFYSTFGGCEIKSLSFEYANLDDQDVEELQRFMTTKQVKGIESLDLSYNNKICPDGFEKIGNMIAEQGIKTLIAIDCDLEKMKLAKLLEGLKNVNLRELDIGYNDNLTEKGFEMLANLVARRGTEILKLRGCQLTEETIKVFYNKLEKTEEKVLLNELDVSYNPEMNPACCEVLGLIIKKFGITTLNLAGCRISEKHLTSLMSTKNIEDIKLHTINLRDNSYPGNIMMEIANIVSKFDIQELDISDCKFSVSKLKKFRTNYSGTKLQKLHLGDEGCELGINYILEICELLTTVNEILYLRCHRLDNSCHRLLNKQSGQTPMIKLCDESEATLD